MTLVSLAQQCLLARNEISSTFFPQEAERLAYICKLMAERFMAGGRLLAFGEGPYSTDAQHVSVEFVHPVIVGKRALPALDLSPHYSSGLLSLLKPEDIVMGFAPPEGNPAIEQALKAATQHRALTLALSGDSGTFTLTPPSQHPFIHQEMIEILYHTLWETVHVFFEHQELGQEIGETAFLYPFLSTQRTDSATLVQEVAQSIKMKAKEDELLRQQIAEETGHLLAETAQAIFKRLRQGGKLILFGNGGSATDANDWAIDCVMPPAGRPAIPAISLSMEPANLTAIANDVGVEVVFQRQLIAHAKPEDVAIGISTSGGSKNIIMALNEARKRKLLTVALLGYDGGEIARRQLADFALVVHSDYIPRIQEIQASIYHTLLDLLYHLLTHHA